ncbi:hypothetical protein F5887DRAFT_1081088 [Amanita rubescens]|nr:hypothetical protein F5887DRAFT_1081088 [Amanita rubescens]
MADASRSRESLRLALACGLFHCPYLPLEHLLPPFQLLHLPPKLNSLRSGLCKSLAQKGTGQRGIKGTKGKKRSWVLDNVYPAFAKHFNSAGPNGPNIVSLKDRYKGNVMEKFAKEKIKGPDVYKRVLRDMYQDAEPDIKATCEEGAKVSNDARNEPPPAAEIFGAQANVKYNTGDALYDLTGWDWGGHGDMVYFTMGDYRDLKGQLITFNITVSNRNGIQTCFRIMMNIYVDHFLTSHQLIYLEALSG